MTMLPVLATNQVMALAKAADALVTEEPYNRSTHVLRREDNGKWKLGDYVVSDGSCVSAQARAMARSADKMDMAALNEGLNKHQPRVRLYDGRVIGLVSRSYQQVTNEEAVSTLLQSGSWVSGMASVSWNGRFMFWLTSDATIRLGELSLMARVTNGQNGNVGFNIDTGLMRLACTNGLTVPVLSEKMRLPHVIGKINTGDLASSFTEFMNIAPHAVRASQLRRINVVSALGSLRGLKSLLSDGVINTAIALASEGSSSSDQSNVPVDGALTTEWGVVQSLAAAARGFTGLRRETTEKYAGRIMVNGFANFVNEVSE